MADLIFTSEQLKQDGQSRVGKTGMQVSGATAIVGLGAAFCRWRGWLHGDLDTLAFGYWITLMTIAASAAQNWSRLRGRG